MKLGSPVEPALRASLHRAASGPEPMPSLADVVRRANAKRRRRHATVGGSALLALLFASGSLAVVEGRRADRAIPVAAAGSTTASELLRPVISLPDCRTTRAVESSGPDVILGRATTTDKSVQVLFDPSRPPPSGPLVVIERLGGKGKPALPDGTTDGALIANATVGGQDATVNPPGPEGHAGADFEVADGSLGLITSRQLTTDQLRQVLDGLRPRPDVRSGFDLSGPALVGLTMVDVAPPAARVTTARSDCARSDGSLLTVTAISGDSAARYAALINLPANAIGRDAGGLTIAVYGPPGDSRLVAALDSVSNASPDYWRSLLAARPR